MQCRRLYSQAHTHAVILLFNQPCVPTLVKSNILIQLSAHNQHQLNGDLPEIIK